MGSAFCVIGLARDAEGIHSLRPIPGSGGGWSHFAFRRGNILEMQLLRLPAERPHIEDRTCAGSIEKVAEVHEPEIVRYLRQAEAATSVSELFGCPIRENKNGSGLFAVPADAKRSICGCETQNLRLEMCGNELRASLVLPSGEALRDLPVVDREWNEFIESALGDGRGANRQNRLDRFLSSHFHHKVLSCTHHYVRLGLTRPMNRGLCWLMLDTLFPLPRAEWLEEI